MLNYSIFKRWFPSLSWVVTIMACNGVWQLFMSKSKHLLRTVSWMNVSSKVMWIWPWNVWWGWGNLFNLLQLATKHSLLKRMKIKAWFKERLNKPQRVWTSWLKITSHLCITCDHIQSLELVGEEGEMRIRSAATCVNVYRCRHTAVFVQSSIIQQRVGTGGIFKFLLRTDSLMLFS